MKEARSRGASLLFKLMCLYQEHAEPYVHRWTAWLEVNWPRGFLGIGNCTRVECYRKGVRCRLPGDADLVLHVPSRGPFGPPSKVVRVAPVPRAEEGVVMGSIYGLRVHVERAGKRLWSCPLRLVHPTRDFLSPGNVVLDRAFMHYLLRKFHRRTLDDADTYTISFLSGGDLTAPKSISHERGVLLGEKEDKLLRAKVL